MTGFTVERYVYVKGVLSHILCSGVISECCLRMGGAISSSQSDSDASPDTTTLLMGVVLLTACIKMFYTCIFISSDHDQIRHLMGSFLN